MIFANFAEKPITRVVVLGLGGLLVHLFTVNPVAAKSCQLNIPNAQVEVKTFEGPTRSNNGHSSPQLAAKFGGHGKTRKKSGWVTRGLTKTSLESRIEVGIQYIKIGKNQFCIGLKNVAAEIGFKHFQVYVARDLKPGSCEYRTTLDHEQAHVAIYKDQLRQFAPRFEQRLERVAASLKPIVSRTANAGHSYYLNKIRGEFQQVYRQFNRETDRRQGRLDTPENYRREQALCPPNPERRLR